MSLTLGVLTFSLALAQQNQVRQFTPQGFVKSVQQVRIEFVQPMVKFGDIKSEAPAQSSCFKEGQGRWVDTKNWVYDFKESLPGGRSCTVTVLGKSYQFNTGGPHIKGTFPRAYRPVDIQQNFVLMLDSAVKKESVAKSAYFVVEGLGDRIPVQIIDGSEAQRIKESAEKEYKYDKDDFKGEFVVLKAQRNFPPGAHVSLVWSKEIQSPAGFSSQQDEAFEFSVAENFKVEFTCEREAPEKPCIPILAMRLYFNSSIAMKDAKGIFLETKDKKKISATNLDEDASRDRVNNIEFKGPFPQNTEFQLFIPANIKDEDGRVLANANKFPLTVKTGENPSLLKFAAPFGVVEAGPEAAIPVTLRRVEKSLPSKFIGWSGKFESNSFKNIVNILEEIYTKPGEERLKTLQTLPVQKLQVEKPAGVSDMEVIGIPLKQAGFYAIEMESSLLGQSLLNKKLLSMFVQQLL